MKKEQISLRLFAGANARNYGRNFLVWGLSAAMMSFALPIQAETSLGGGKFY